MSGWAQHTLGDICRFEKGTSPTLKTEPGEYPLVVTADFRRTSSTYQIEGPAVCVPLISSTGHGDAALHRVHYQEGRFALANLLVALVPHDPEQCCAKYLYYLLTATKGQILVPLMQGTANVSLKPQDIAGVPVELPSATEQQRVVSLIDSVKEKLAAATRLRQTSSGWTEKLVAAEEFNVWPERTLAGALPLEKVTTFLARGRQTAQGSSDHYLIKTQHVQMGRYVNSTITLGPEAAAKVDEEALARPGDILVACSAAGCLGRVAFYSNGTRRASTDSHVAIARPRPDIVSPEYLYAYLRGAQGQVQLRSREKGDWKREKVGFRLTELNVADTRKVPVPVPSPAEQRRIVEYVEEVRSRVDTLRDLQAKTAAELDAMLPSVLDRSFRGEL